MATLDLWLEGDWGEENIVWHQEGLSFDLERFHSDQLYAEVINDYIRHALANMAEGLSEIAMRVPEEKYEWIDCED